VWTKTTLRQAAVSASVTSQSISILRVCLEIERVASQLLRSEPRLASLDVSRSDVQQTSVVLARWQSTNYATSAVGDATEQGPLLIPLMLRRRQGLLFGCCLITAVLPTLMLVPSRYSSSDTLIPGHQIMASLLACVCSHWHRSSSSAAAQTRYTSLSLYFSRDLSVRLHLSVCLSLCLSVRPRSYS